ncbi:hypothetical protein MCUN1_003748 [Malassezia cuniculi]|uniref:Uncharacterized protein n=1 Tax=Malassezia cuniculi TaxID=948313 RepID=A0AAF0ETN1_9BASI|nr:hypothetical protein MCUN1_003748 [Malassezia cuniculi]
MRIARVKYVLGSEFYEPPAAHHALLQSATLYNGALQRNESPAPGQVPSAVWLDIVANLAYALQSLGELVDEFGWVDVEHALAFPMFGIAELDSPSSLYAAAATLFGLTAQGQLLVLSGASDMGTSTGDDASRPAPLGDESEAYTSSLVAPSSYLEMIAAQLSSTISLIPHSQAESVAAIQQDAVDALGRADAYICSLVPGFGASQSPDGEWDAQISELKWASISLRVSTAVRVSELGGVDASLDDLCTEVLSAGEALLAAAPPRESLTGVRLSGAEGSAAAKQTAEYEATVERLSEVADHAHALGRALLRRAASAQCSSSLERAWEVCGFASKCMLAAVAPLEPAGKGASTARVSTAQSLNVPGAPMAWTGCI